MGLNLSAPAMIYCACGAPMRGIRSKTLRDTCWECGGYPLSSAPVGDLADCPVLAPPEDDWTPPAA